MKALGVIGGVILAAALIVGLWFGGWWVQRQVVQRGGEIRQDSFARQTALQQEVLSLHQDITTIDVQITTATPGQKPALEAQRVALVNRLCDAYARMLPEYVPTEIAGFAGGEC